MTWNSSTTAWEVALRHGLIDSLVLKQAVALLRRGAALSTAGRGLLAAAR